MSERPGPQPKTTEKKMSLPRWGQVKKLLTFTFLGLGLPFLFQATTEADTPEDNLSIIETMPSQEDPVVQAGIEHLIEVGELNPTDPDGRKEGIVIGDSVAEPLAPVSNTINIINWSERSTSFGNYPTPDSGGFMNQAGLLERIDTLSDTPEYVVLMFGRNDCNLINVSNTYELLNNSYNPETSRVEGTGYDVNWLNEVFSLIDALEARGIKVTIVGSPPTATNRESYLMNDILRGIAQRKELPFIDGTEHAQDSARSYGFTYGSSILTEDMQSDGTHFYPAVYPDLNRLIAGSLESIDLLTTRSSTSTRDVTMSAELRDRLVNSAQPSRGPGVSIPTQAEQSIVDRIRDVQRRGNQ